MGTRSTIAKMQDDGTIRSIYCHWDGYPDGVGRILGTHYTDSSKIEQLLGLGDISSLDVEIGEKQDFNNRKDGWTLAYGRDRGETDIDSLWHPTIDMWLGFRQGSGCEYGYLWVDGMWVTYNLYERSK